jgi:hypothetical protein
MVLTFTGSLSIAGAGREDVRTMLIGAIGCNFAWGVIDAALFLMGCLAERGQGLATLHALRTADPHKSRGLIADALPPIVASVLTPAELDSLGTRLRALPEPARRARLGGHEWLGAFGVFLLVFFATFPVAIPFLVFHDPRLALRTSNGIAIVLLFVTGYAFGRITAHRPWLVGLGMVVLGGLFVLMTIALGG